MKKDIIFKKNFCRVCKKRNLTKVLDFGPTPLANAFLTIKDKEKQEYFYPLEVYFCNNCSFLQLGHVVNPKILFSDYIYVSSTSLIFVNHFVDFANYAYKKFSLDKNSLVLDIGSNDGILLKPFKKLGVKVLGIEPARKIAKLANNNNVPTIADFFTLNLSKKIVKKYKKAKIITATNVFAHIDNLDEILKAVNVVLEKDGVFVVEVPYIIDFIKNNYFDLVYHEHLSYWSVKTLDKLVLSHNLKIIDVEKISVHGGSIRAYIAQKSSKHMPSANVNLFLTKEKTNKIYKLKTYKDFAVKIEKNKIELLELLSKLKRNGANIAGYGAPAKGNTLLNYFSIGTNILDFIVDDSSWKQGMYTPGKRIPVKSAKYLYTKKIDYLLILAWNFSDSIMKNNLEFKKSGGKFIIPVPKPVIN